MAIRKRGSHWLVAVEQGRDPKTGRRRRAFLTLPTRREAEREEARLRHEAAAGLDLDPAKLTLAEYLARWLEAVRPNLAPSTYLRYEGLLRCQVVPYTGNIALQKLRPLHVEHLYARLRETGRVSGEGGLALRTLLHVHRVLSDALEQAVRWQLVPRNVCRAVETPRATKASINVLAPDLIRRLIERAWEEDSVYGDAVILAVHTGLRQGELLGLGWDAVNFERSRLSIRRVLQHLPRQGITFREPKTAKSGRTIPIGPTALEALRHCRRRQVASRLALGPAYRDHNLVFASPDGYPLSPNNLRPAFERLLQRAGVGRVRFHDLRHAHASLLMARGVHPKIVSERLGHSSIAITLDTYSHVLPDLQESAVDEFDAWLSGRK